MFAFRRFGFFFLTMLALLAGSPAMFGQIHLTSINVASAPPVITNVTIQGTGFPATAAIANTTVTITPPPGNGAPVTATPIFVTAAGTTKSVVFTVPASLTAAQPLVGCQISVSALGVNSDNSVSLTVNPPATVTSVSPGGGQRGTAVNVQIAGNYSHFQGNGLSTITAGAGVTVSNVVLVDATHINATFTIDPAATAGLRTVQVKTGAEVASLTTGFLVSVNPALSLSLNPVSAQQGAAGQIVHITGNLTNFVQGQTIASFGDGVKINSVTVNSLTSADVNITVDNIAKLGTRTVTLVTNQEYALSTNGFTVTTNGAQLTGITPNTAPQGTSTTVTLTGTNTHWVSAGTQVSFGGGIVVGNVVVNSATSLTVNITVPPATPQGNYSVTVTTLGEVVSQPTLPQNLSFAVTQATPSLTLVTPTQGQQGQTLDVNVTGQFTNFVQGNVSFNFGGNITVNSITVNSTTSVKANITIANTATAGGRTATLSSNGTNFNFSFTVTASTAAISSVTPGSGLQGATVALQVVGSNTHWVQGLTAASLDPQWITINRVQVADATHAEVDITISTQAPLGARNVTLSTGGEIVTANGAFTVLPFTPTLSINPSSGMIGTTVPVIFNGSFTHFINNTTTANISGNGVTITNFQVTSPFTAQGNLVIDPSAPASPAVLCTPGNRTLTLTTVQGVIDEIVTAPFCVTSTPAVLTSISPSHTAVPVTNLAVSITGQYTHFTNAGPNPTQVGFGPNITVNNLVVVDATHLTMTINVAANAALGYRQAFVNTGAEQLTIGFHLDYPATSTLTSITPNNAAQGQTLHNVVITGNLSQWNNTTIPIIGAGITTTNVQILGPTSAMLDLTVSPTTTVGGRSVTMITNGGAEVESASLFSVTPSIASVSAIGIGGDCSVATNCPATNNVLANINQGDTKSFRVVGVLTNFLQGETTLDFGPDIAVTLVHVVDSTHLYGQITVGFNAQTGFRSFRAITDGEIAPSFSNAVNVQAVNGTINISPNSAPQGTLVDITVNGVGPTHFNAGNTTATFGSGQGIVDATSGLDTITNITFNSTTQMILHTRVKGTAYTGLRTITVTTTNVVGAPQNIEQLTLPNSFSVSLGAALITNVTPTSGLQGLSANLQVTGQNTNFLTGVTTAFMSTGGCLPGLGANVNVSNVTATDATHATVAIAVDVTAPTGFRTLCMYTQGEAASYSNAFQVLPGIPTFNGVGPVSGLQGQTLTGVTLLGQFTHWTQGVSTVTFGQGITTSNFHVVDATHATVDLVIDPLAQAGGRNVVVTTNAEVVQGANAFLVLRGPAILSTISPSSANQGQHILMQVTGQFTHWAQGLTQFSIGGGDITVNGFVIQSATTALADLTLSPTAYLGTRTVTMSTAGEVVSLQDGFLVTGGIPSIISISPSTYKQGDTNVNVQITGAFTHWDNTTTVFMGQNITVNSVTRNSDTSLTAIITVDAPPPAYTIGLRSVLVTTGAQALPGQVNIISNAPPQPYISYEYPSVALKGQTLTVNLYGQYTKWLPGSTFATFGAGITVNTFQVTGLGTAQANITIDPNAGVGNRTVTLTTGAEVENTSFYVTVGTPVISLIDPPTGIQGQTRIVNLVGQYTTWSIANPPVFNFGSGVTVVPGSVSVFGPTAARLTVQVDTLASLGGRSVSATNGAEVSYGFFSVTPSTATISSVTPNTVMQGTSGFVTHVVGFNTSFSGITSFDFGSGVSITNIAIIDTTHADVTMTLDPYAAPGLRTVHAHTAGEDAYLVNSFVVQPGTPVLISSTGSGIQQNTFHVSVLGQFTNFVAGWPAAGATTVSLGNGAIITGINVTGPQSVDVTGTIDPLAYVGCRNVVVTTGAQVLNLYSAFCIGAGPAQITNLNPANGIQGTTMDVAITGTNTNFAQNITTGSFGPGISLNTLTINSPTSATANITIAANATVQQNSVTLQTQGEIATRLNGFTIVSNTPTVAFITPTSSTQGSALDVSVTGNLYTHWSLANTTADFGTGITATVTAVPDATHATVHLVISPTAPTGNHAVRMLTNLGGGGQEIAVYTIGAGNGTPGYFVVNAGNAVISSATPSSPATVHQNDNGDIIAVVGSNTHFVQGTTTVTFCSGVNTVAVAVVDATHLNATVNVDTFATVGTCGATATTGGEVATGSNLFAVQAGIPVINSLSVTSAHQNDTLNVTVNGLYTHFTNASTADFGAGITVNGAPSSVTSTSATFNITIDQAAALTTRTVTVNSPGPEAASKSNAFTVLAGVPQIISISIPSGPQGLTQSETITGLFTNWSTSSVVSVSGTGVTVGNPPGAPDGKTLTVNFTVTVGAPAGPRNVTVTTGGQVLTLVGAFTVQPGSPNLSSLSPNIGVPNSTVPVTLTGVFTHFTNGATKANFGPGISVNGGGYGNDGFLTVSDNFTASATLTIDPAATLGPRNVVVTTPAPPLAVAETFTVNNGFTVQTTPSTPVVTFLSPSMGLSGTVNASNVPINTNITVVFNEPMKASTITSANAFISDATTQGSCWTAAGVPANVSLDLSGRVLTIQPVSLLAVGRDYYLQLNSYNVPGGTPTIQDASGTQNLGHVCQRFTTGFAQDNTGPTFITGNIPAGATGVPTNVHPTVGFDKPVSAATISGLTFTQAGNPVAGTWSYSTDFTQYIFTPSTNLTPATTYTVTYTAALTDSVGHALTNPGSFSFTTGAGTDFSGNSVLSITPIYNSTVATNPIIRFTTAKPINPLTVTQFYVYNNVSGAYTFGTVSHSADFKTWDLTLPGPLAAGTQYRFNSYSMYDWAGNCCVSFNQYFYTADAQDSSQPTVVSVSPANGTPNVPVNSPVWVHFSEQLDSTTLPANAITLNGGAVAGTVAWNGTDYSTIIFTPAAPLSTSTTYNVAVQGLRDTSGNPMAVFAGSSFQTAASSTPDTTHGTINITPTGNSVPVNTNVVINLSKPVNPLSINSQSVYIHDNTINKDVAGNIAISVDLKTLTFTPTLPFPAQHQILTYVSWNASLYDLAGNTFNGATPNFTTSSAVDLTAPTVISVTPPDASSGIGPNNPVVVTFSKAINPATITNNVAVYTGSDLYTASYSLSADATTIYFNTGTMPYGTKYTVVASPNLADLAGNHLANQFTAAFTTAPQPVVQRPSVNVVRPGNGATGVPVTSTVTFFTSAPMNPATVNTSSVHVSQNGVLLNGVISFAAGNQAITFTPNSNLTPGALIEMWFTSAATDAGGNALFDYYAHFTVAPDLSATPLTIISRGPCAFCTVAYNSVVEVLFSKPVNPATVTSSTFIVKDSSNVTPVAGTISFADNNRLIRFTPNAPGFAHNNYFYVYLTSNIQDVNNLNFAGSSSSYNFYMYAGNPSDTTPPFVSGLAPTGGATNIGSNALVSVTFSENVDSMTLDPANVTLTGPGGNIPVSLSYNNSTFVMTVTPQAPMPAGLVTLQLNGVTDYSGNALSPTPYTSTFTVQNAPDYAAPSVVQTSWVNNQNNVPVTSGFSVTFNEPIDLRSVVANNTVYLQDASLGYPNVPFTLSWSSGNTVMLLTPTPASGLLNVGHQYRILITQFADLDGNVSGTILNQYFNTVLVAPAGGPVITQFVPPAGSTTVAPNVKPQIQFDRPIKATSLGSVTFVKTAGSVPVPMTPQVSGGGTILTIVPDAILVANTQYTVTVAGVQDAAGNALAAPVSHTFTTGPAIDLVAPAVSTVTPLSNATVGTTPLLKMTFNEPINPITATNFAMYQYGINRTLNALSLTWSADLKSVQFNYPGSLDPNDHFYFYLNGFCDLSGNCGNSNAQHFYTSSSVDNTPLTVSSVNPPNGASGVPVNPALSVRLSKTVAPTSVSNNSVSVSGVVGTTVALASDGQTLNVTLPGLLSANTAYTVQVPAGGVTDNNGNAVTLFSSTFTTSASGLSDTTHGGVSLTDPSPGSTGVTLSKVITVTFSKPYNPNSIIQDSLVVCINNNCNNRIAGTTAIVDANHLSFTPAVGLPPGATISVYVYPFTAYMTDLAGNIFDNPYLYNATFSTASVVDNTPPVVSNMTPTNGSTGVGPLATVSLTFNKSLDQSTVNTSSFALYNGSNNLGANVSISADRRTVYLSTSLPFNSTITVTANTSVKDYAGNNMASSYSASFATEAQPLNFNPSVIQTRPGNGAPLNSKITIFTNSQINLASAQSGILVAQNGALIPGTVNLTADQHGIVWTPNSNYQAGAFIEVFVTSAVTDTNLNPINGTTFSFTTQSAACSTPAITSYNPSRYTTLNLLNPVVEVQFCEPIDPATVNSTTFNVRTGSSPGVGTPIAGSLSFLNNNTIVRFTPTADFPANQYFAVQLTTGIKDVAANAFAGDGYYEYVPNTAIHDNTPLTVSTVTPVNGSTNIGDNAPIRIVFSKLIDGLTVTSSTVTLMNGPATIPYTYTFGTTSNGSKTVMNITPLVPLPDNAPITLHVTSGVQDLTGSACADSVTAFQTGAGADFSGPVATQLTVDNGNNSGVPVNTTFTITFNEPLDPSTVSGNPSGNNTCCFFYYDSSCPGGQCYPPATVNISPDLKSVTIIPTNPMTANNSSMRYYWQGATDQNGNAMTNGSQFFTTGPGADSTPPTVLQSTPVTTATNVPTNVVPEIIFSEAVSGTSLGSITLNGSPVTAVLNNAVYGNDTVVKLVPSALLSPNTLYTVAVSGVQDVAGNTMVGTYTFTFTTGPNFNVNNPNFVAATVSTTGGTVALPQNTNVNNVLKTNPTFTFAWDAGIDYASLLGGAIWLTDTSNAHINIPVTFAYVSTDQKTVTVQVNGTLNGSTQYRMWIRLQGYPVSLSGVYDFNQRLFPFTTQP